jgi:hypothetical protein
MARDVLTGSRRRTGRRILGFVGAVLTSFGIGVAVMGALAVSVGAECDGQCQLRLLAQARHYPLRYFAGQSLTSNDLPFL